jgi:hypothetical protein
MMLMLGAPLVAAEHHITRDDALHAIEGLARRSRRSEIEVARQLLALMRGDDAQADVPDAGRWLHGAGRARLEQALGLPGWWPAARTLARRLRLPVYLGGVAAGTARGAGDRHRAGDVVWRTVRMARAVRAGQPAEGCVVRDSPDRRHNHGSHAGPVGRRV